VLAITVAVSLWVEVSPSGGQFGELLALDKEAVRGGEYWRLLTVALVHGGFLHLAFNMYALYIAGPLIEALYGRAMFLAFYLLAAAGGSVASYLFLPGVSVGASGAIFGLFGLVFMATFVHRPALGRQARALTSQIGTLIVINLVIGFGIGGLARIDNAAHVGGLVVGAWLGLMVAPRGAATLASLWQRVPQTSGRFRDRHATALAVTGIAVVILVLAVALLFAPFWA
jgi:rhomboid protease GluP